MAQVLLLLFGTLLVGIAGMQTDAQQGLLTAGG